jgi:hypothetical protein
MEIMNSSVKKTAILVIAEQERLRNLFAFTKGITGVRIKFAATVEQGLETAAADAPALIFIQGRLAGLSGEIIARTLRLELSKLKPKIILFSNPEDTPEPGKKSSCKTLDSSLSDDLLTLEIKSIAAMAIPEVKKQFPVARKTPQKKTVSGGGTKILPKKNKVAVPVNRQSVVIPREAGTAVRTDTGNMTAAQPEDAEPVAVEVTDIVKIRHQAQVLDVACPEGKAEASSFTEQFDSLLEKAKPAAATVAKQQVTLATHTPDYGLPTTHGEQGKAARCNVNWLTNSRRTVLFTLLLTVVAVIAATFIMQRTNPVPDKTGSTVIEPVDRTADTPPVPSPAEQPRTALPSFIPKLAPDAQYAKANPGWERYSDSATEYRIFREDSSIRAVQVFDRSGQGIATRFFNAMLKELAGSPAYVVEAREQKGDFSVEKGQLAINANIIIYRKQAGAQVTAFVVDFR